MHIASIVLLISVVACGGTSAPRAYVPPSASAGVTASPTPLASPSAMDSPAAPPSGVPTISPITAAMPPPSLTCSRQYQPGHLLVAALLFSQGYGSLAILDVSDPLAPILLCTVNNSPYPLQPIQWLSRSEFLLVLSQPNRLLDVDISRQSITTARELNGNVFEARLSQDRAWLATMESQADGSRLARLYGRAGERTLASYPIIGGHGGTIYGFGGPTIGFSPDGSLVLAVDWGATASNSTVPALQVFDLQGLQIVSAAGGLWGDWVNGSLYYSEGTQKVYKWVRGAAPVAVLQSSWWQPTTSPDGRTIAYLTNPGYRFTLDVLDVGSGTAKSLKATGQRIYPLFVTPNLVWASELNVCDNCYGGVMPTGKVFAYDLSTGAESEVRLPDLLGPLMGASLSGGA